MRAIVLATCIALGGCGSAASTGEARLALALADGTEIRATTGDVTVVVLAVFGADGRSVTWRLEGAPPYVAVGGDGLRIAPPRGEPAGAFDVVVTASAAGESSSRTIRLVVEAANSAPIIASWTFVDASEWGWCPAAEYQGVALPVIACLDRIGIRGLLADPMLELDAAGVEVETALLHAPFTGTPTHRSGLRSDWAWQETGTYVAYDVALDGLEPGRLYRVAVRGFDAFGATEPWRELPQPVVSAPYVLRPQGYAIGNSTGALCVRPGFSRDFGLVAGDLPPGTSIAVTGLPASFAPKVDGGVLTVTLPPDTPMNAHFDFDVALPFGEALMTQGTYIAACPFQ